MGDYYLKKVDHTTDRALLNLKKILVLNEKYAFALQNSVS